ncbi:invasion associated locus B family protein [Amaricoccus sp.]|uniref:invasion associated locus B family protein n=1 Tax=Amaricoccus sp. TaxID=1872485 RepID=UPI001B4D99A8|nr:invasion associated locus B family protein [Amaricoccus sp.]MBP7240428.1 hypothetical protein [Amaricoccus sp.]
MPTGTWKALALTLAALVTSPALAQAAAERVAAHNDWTVFQTGAPRECYIVSQPTGSVAKRDGQNVQVNRGDIRLFVRFNPGEGVRNEVSFTGGYPLRAGTPVQLKVGSESFNLTPGPGDASGWAWPAAQDDGGIVAAMRRGSTATITGVSARGTTTTDTFSLSGFTAAINKADELCK